MRSTSSGSPSVGEQRQDRALAADQRAPVLARGLVVQHPRRAELDEQVVVGVDHRRAAHQRVDVGRGDAQQAPQVRRSRSRRCARGRSCTARRQLLPARQVRGRERPVLRQQQQVGAAGQVGEAVDERKLAAQRRDDRRQRRRIERVELHPLQQPSAGRQRTVRDGEELAREQVRDAAHPGVRRLRDDDVVALLGRREVRARVVEHQVHARVVERAAAHVVEQVRRLDDRGLDLDRVDALDVGMRRDRARGHPRGVADHQHLLRRRAEQQRQLPEQHLGRHVAEARRVDLAVDAQRQDAALAVHRHRRVDAVAVEHQLAVGAAVDRRELDAEARARRRAP